MEIRIKINDRLVQFARGLFSRRVFPFLLAVVLLGGTVTLLAEPFVIPFVFSTGEVISSSQMNTNFEQVGERINAVQTQVNSLVASGGSVWSASAPHIYYSGGNVGVGTSVPSSLLHLYNAGGDVGLRVESADVGYDPNVTLGYAGDSDVKLWRDVPDDSFKLDVGGTTRVTVDTNGQVGIGTTSPAQALHVNGTVRATRFEDTSTSYYLDPASTSNLNGAIFQGWITGGVPGSTKGYLQLLDSPSGDDTIVLNAATNANSWINSWRVGIGTTEPLEKFTVGIVGDLTKAVANAWTTFSDERYKEDIVPLDHALDKIDAITGYYYHWIGSDSSRQIGVIAQEVEEVLPEVVSTDDDGYKAVDYGRLTAVLIQAVKELQAENVLLTQRLSDLEERLPQTGQPVAVR